MAKFRSWCECLKRFIYFEDGKYSMVYFNNEINPECEFDWVNAEQEFTRHKVTFFKGDKFSINGAVYGVIAIKNGILGFERYETCCDEYIGFSKISEYPIQIMNKLGNTHQNKEAK